MSARRRWTRLPSITALAGDIHTQWGHLYEMGAQLSQEEIDDPEVAHCEVRLHVLTSDRMAFAGGSDVRFGDGQYDRLHGDAIGVSGFNVLDRPTRAAATRMAREVLADARDQMAMAA